MNYYPYVQALNKARAPPSIRHCLLRIIKTTSRF